MSIRLIRFEEEFTSLWFYNAVCIFKKEYANEGRKEIGISGEFIVLFDNTPQGQLLNVIKAKGRPDGDEHLPEFVSAIKLSLHKNGIY